MINSDVPVSEMADADAAVHRIVRAGAAGAVLLAAIATAVVIALWFAFYFMVFLPRGAGP